MAIDETIKEQVEKGKVEGRQQGIAEGMKQGEHSKAMDIAKNFWL